MVGGSARGRSATRRVWSWWRVRCLPCRPGRGEDRGTARAATPCGGRGRPRVRPQHGGQAAATGGITVENRARFGYSAPPIGTTDGGRARRLTAHLPPHYATAVRGPRRRGGEAPAAAGRRGGARRSSASRTAAAAPTSWKPPGGRDAGSVRAGRPAGVGGRAGPEGRPHRDVSQRLDRPVPASDGDLLDQLATEQARLRQQ